MSGSVTRHGYHFSRVATGQAALAQRTAYARIASRGWKLGRDIGTDRCQRALSEQNVELSRRALEAYNSHDIEAFLVFFDPEIEFHSAFAAVGGGVYHGHDGMRRFVEELVDAWGDEGLRLEPEAYFDLGEHTISFYVAHGRGRESGANVALPAAMVARWRDGLCVYSKGYAHREDALRDLGVSEDALEPIAP